VISREKQAAAAAAVIAVVAVALWGRGARGPVVAPRRAMTADRDAGVALPRAATSAETARGAGETARRGADAGAVTVRDRALRDEIRAGIWRAWTASAQNPAPQGDPLRAPLPPRPASLEPSYIRDRIREDFIPMAQACYESLLTRRPGAEGRAVMSFEIVSDANLGGVVESAEFVGEDGGVPDAGVREGEFLTCMRESMLTVAFLSPGQSGRVTVRYPFNLRAATDAGRE
jgi:hypothetical protein